MTGEIVPPEQTAAQTASFDTEPFDTEPSTVTRGAGPAFALAAVMAAAGLSHFLVPRSYEQIVPRVLGAPGPWVRASGSVELGCAALLVCSRTRRMGGWLTAAVLVAVFPANVQMARDGGLAGHRFPLGSPVMAWLRLPLQLPLVVWARAVALRAGE
jgi:uncharacterized membrane protein